MRAAMLGVLGLAMAGCSPATEERDESGGINISRFAFRDMNRNGRYDFGERPYAGLQVELDTGAGKPLVRKSNIAGFTNFRLALGRDDRDINAPGPLTFTAIAPDGWMITTPETTARTTAHAQPGSPSGLYIDPLLPLVGVAPVLTLSGSAAPGGRVLVVEPDGREQNVVADASGVFTVPAHKGEWIVDWTPDDGRGDARPVVVGDWPVRVARPIDGTPAGAGLAVVDFDGLTTSDTLFEIPEGYGGLCWRNWVATHQKLYRGDGYINAAVSGEYVAYNSSGHPATICSDKPFDFLGSHVGVAWPEAEDADIVVTAWRGDEKVAEETFRAVVEGALRFDADWRAVTRVEFRHERHWQVVIDDVAVRLPPGN